MTPHVLDRPIWRALLGRQASLSVGNDRARRYPGDISPLAAAADDSPESLPLWLPSHRAMALSSSCSWAIFRCRRGSR